MTKLNTKLHHFAYNIKPNSLERVLELFDLLACTQSYREDNQRWCMIWQKPLNIDIQIIETNDPCVPTEIKKSTHIAFLSDTPKEDIKHINEWAKKKNLNFSHGGWSDKELWFDFPDLFINFVIEIMHTSVVD
ncbi:MAG: hypothetical protein COB02_18515 [Candidatus Cloacimonadota bacterium]|nr:MAG: hypothetical protein COB02_18515 [Candidatus Cloacimonadota bacterium]